MSQPPEPPLKVYVQPGETIRDALLRCLITIRDEAKDEAAGTIRIPPGVHIYGSGYHPQTRIIERRTTGTPFPGADGIDDLP